MFRKCSLSVPERRIVPVPAEVTALREAVRTQAAVGVGGTAAAVEHGEGESLLTITVTPELLGGKLLDDIGAGRPLDDTTEDGQRHAVSEVRIDDVTDLDVLGRLLGGGTGGVLVDVVGGLLVGADGDGLLDGGVGVLRGGHCGVLSVRVLLMSL